MGNRRPTTRSIASNDPPPSLASDRAAALKLTPVSRETLVCLDRFAALLLAWQRTTHLVAPSTLPQLWTRHIADSLQLLDLAPDARIWVDVGSGGGFPGLVIACALVSKPGAAIHLVEANARKAAFLREAQRITETPVHVHAERMEAFAPRFAGPLDAVCARAVSPLKSLLRLTFPLLHRPGVVGFFPKGKNAERELQEASNNWRMHATLAPSRTEPTARIIVVRQVEPRGRLP
jgi:16S rRNA (guanine527-N7)-methyltransferase